MALLTDNEFENELRQYKIMLFIDDLDLLTNEEKDILVTNVKEYCERSDSFYLMTYRKNEFTFDNQINTIKIHNFNIRQIEDFITKFFEGSDRGHRFIQILKESDILSKLPTTPLTVTLLSLLYDENNYEIPATLSDIYTDFVNVLIGKLNVRNKVDLLMIGIKKRLFSTLALSMLDSKTFELEYNKFEEHINGFLEERGYEIQTDEQLMQIIDNSGLLYISDEKKVGFKQQAFIEFLASVEIFNNKRETYYPKLIENFNFGKRPNNQKPCLFRQGKVNDFIKMFFLKQQCERAVCNKQKI